MGIQTTLRALADPTRREILNMLKKEVTYERMHMIKGSIGSNEPDDINKLGSKFLAKWRKNENWPF